MRTCKLSRRRDANAGFTLLELGIVLAVIGILSAILVPSFTGIVERARQTAAQQNCRLYAEQFAFYLFDEAGEGELGDYIFVSGNYAFCVENGAFREADYAAKDGKLLSEDGKPIEGSNKEAGVSLVTDLPDDLMQDLVTVYEVYTEPELPEIPAAPSGIEESPGYKEAHLRCKTVMSTQKDKYLFQDRTVFVYGEFAFVLQEAELQPCGLETSEGGLLSPSKYGLTKLNIPASESEGGVVVYVTDESQEWITQMGID